MKSHFDGYAKNYQDLQDKSTKISGESWDYFLRNKAQFVKNHSGDLRPAKILDFGCGIGGLSWELKKVFPDSSVHGFDVSSESIKLVPDVLTHQGKFTHDYQHLDTDYDLAVVSGVFHHVAPDERNKVASQLAHVLKTGGRAVVFEHNPLNPLTRYAVRQCEFDHDALLVFPGPLKNVLTSSGLSHLELSYLVFFPKPLSWLRRFDSHLSWCPLGATYAWVGEK